MRSILTTLVLGAFSLNSFAGVCEWSGVNGKWSDSNNWKNGKIPRKEDSVQFKVGANCRVEIKLKKDFTVTGDFILENGKFHPGRHTITVGRDFLTAKNSFSPESSTLILTGTGKLKASRFNKLVAAFPDQITTLETTAIYPKSVELKGGTLVAAKKSGMKIYGPKPVLKGFDKSVSDIGYISFWPGKECEIEVPPIKTKAAVYFESGNAKVTYIVKNEVESEKTISIYGTTNGLATVKLIGGKISAYAMNLGFGKDRVGILEVLSGSINLKKSLHIRNPKSKFTAPKGFASPKIRKDYKKNK